MNLIYEPLNSPGRSHSKVYSHTNRLSNIDKNIEKRKNDGKSTNNEIEKALVYWQLSFNDFAIFLFWSRWQFEPAQTLNYFYDLMQVTNELNCKYLMGRF